MKEKLPEYDPIKERMMELAIKRAVVMNPHVFNIPEEMFPLEEREKLLKAIDTEMTILIEHKAGKKQ